MTDISNGSHFVMAGSMDSFHVPFDSLFDLAVHITASIETRITRIHKREYAMFGNRILKGGDIYDAHQRFLDSSARYDSDGFPCLNVHKEWANSLACKVIHLDGEEDLYKNTQTIVSTYLDVKHKF